MKILQVVDTLSVGGAEKMSVQLANLFSENGHEVALLYFQKTENNILKSINLNVKIYFVNIKKQKYNPFKFLKILNIFKNYDLVHVHMRSALKISYLSTFGGVFFNRIVFHDHTGAASKYNDSSKGFLLYKSIRKFYYVSVCDQLRQYSILRFKLQPRNTSVISNFVSKPIKSSFETFDFNKKNIECLVVGNFKKPKNQFFLINLCLEANKIQDLNIRFHLIGEMHEKEYYANIIEDVYKKDLKKQFIIYDNFSSIFEFNQKINFAIMPSSEESGPLVLIEYLILNLPFLAYNTGDVTNKMDEFLPNQVLNSFDEKLWIERIQTVNFNNLEINYNKIYETEFSDNVAYIKWLEIYNSKITK